MHLVDADHAAQISGDLNNYEFQRAKVEAEAEAQVRVQAAARVVGINFVNAMADAIADAIAGIPHPYDRDGGRDSEAEGKEIELDKLYDDRHVEKQVQIEVEGVKEEPLVN